MISYAEFHRMPQRRKKAMEQGIHQSLNIPKTTKIYLDNGAFYFSKHDLEPPIDGYREFVKKAKPDWYPIPQDFIPTPQMELEKQQKLFHKTMQMNRYYSYGKYVPVIHISRFLKDYVHQLKRNKKIMAKPEIALGGIVPNLLRAPKAISHQEIINSLLHICEEFKDKKIHVFGIGGTATLHIAALLGFNSVDSCGWRNRAARGMIQLPGTGERSIAKLGSWRGREISQEELKKLKKCQCPACKKHGIKGLQAHGSEGFYNRATHNLWVLLEEARQIQEHLIVLQDYQDWYQEHLDNTIYRPLIARLVEISLP